MKSKCLQIIFQILAIPFAVIWVSAQGAASSEAYLTWTAAQAEKIGKSTRENGKAGGNFDLRVISTNKAINYGLRATLMTPEVIRAAARHLQLRDRLTDEETRKIVKDAESAGDLVVMIEINPNEGSGVIPLDWRAFLQPKGLKAGSEGAIPGIKSPHLKKVPALSGLYGRNYEYDAFWVVFPLTHPTKGAQLSADIAEIQLIVGIYGSEGRISWKMLESIREKLKTPPKN